MLHEGVLLLLAFTCLQHECQDFSSPCNGNACVHRLDLGLYSHLKEFWRSGVRTHVNWKNSPQRRIKPTTLHQAGQQAQHTTNELFRPKLLLPFTCTWKFDHLDPITDVGGGSSNHNKSDQWHTCKALDLMGSKQGLVGPVTIHHD